MEPSCIADVAAAVENGLSVPQKVKHGNTIEPKCNIKENHQATNKWTRRRRKEQRRTTKTARKQI